MLAFTGPVLLADVGVALLFGFVGLAITVGSIAGIVAIAKGSGTDTSTGQRFAAVIGVGCLALFAVVGLLLTGCGATMASH